MSLSQVLQGVKTSRLARDASWMMAGQCLGYILQGVYFVILARLLGVVEYGIFVGAFAFVNLVGRYSALGSGPVLVRYVSVDRSSFSVYWGNMILLTTIGGVSLTALLYLAGRHFLNRESAALVLLAAVANCFGLQFMTCAAQIFQAMGQMRMTAMLNLLTSLLRTMAAAAMWLTLHRASARQWTVASTLVSLLGATVAVVTIWVRFPRPRFSLSTLKKRLCEGVEFAFASSTTSAYNDLDKAMLSHYGLNAANGIYTLAYRVVDIAAMPIVSLRDAAMPTMFRKGDESLEEASDFARKLWSRCFPAACLAALAMFVLAPLIPSIAGPGFVEDSYALRWLCLIPVFRSVHEISGSALTGAGLQRYRTGTQVAAVALNLGMNLLLIPALGWRGAALSSLATDGLLGLMNWNLLTLLVSRRKRVCAF